MSKTLEDRLRLSADILKAQVKTQMDPYIYPEKEIKANNYKIALMVSGISEEILLNRKQFLVQNALDSL